MSERNDTRMTTERVAGLLVAYMPLAGIKAPNVLALRLRQTIRGQGFVQRELLPSLRVLRCREN